MIKTNPISIPEYLSRYRKDEVLTLTGPLYCDKETEIGFTEPVIFVDGGTQWRLGEEGIAVGDGDSSQFKMDILLNPDKDFSDLAFALESSLRLSLQETLAF